jgi:hypothetical protein
MSLRSALSFLAAQMLGGILPAAALRDIKGKAHEKGQIHPGKALNTRIIYPSTV